MERTRSARSPAPGPSTARVHLGFTATSVKVAHLHRKEMQGDGGGGGGLTSCETDRRLWTDLCNYQKLTGAAPVFTAAACRLIFTLIVFFTAHFLLVYQQEEALCLDVGRAFLYERSGAACWYSGHLCRRCCCHSLLWKLAVFFFNTGPAAAACITREPFRTR